MHNPYIGYRLRLWWQGRAVAGFGQGSALGGEELVLRHGSTSDRAFAAWASQRRSFWHRETLDVEMYDESGQRLYWARLNACWVAEYRGVTSTATQETMLPIQVLTLRYEAAMDLALGAVG